MARSLLPTLVVGSMAARSRRDCAAVIWGVFPSLTSIRSVRATSAGLMMHRCRSTSRLKESSQRGMMLLLFRQAAFESTQVLANVGWSNLV